MPVFDGVREHLAPGRLLKEPLDPPVLVGDDDAELQRVRYAGQGHGDQGALVLVEPHHGGQVDVGEGVTGDDDERPIAQGVFGILHAARGAERHLLGRVLQVHPEVFAVAEVVADERGQELDGDDGVGAPVPPQQPQDVFHDRPVGYGQQGLGLVGGHRTQPRPFPACHHDGLQRLRRSLRIRVRGHAPGEQRMRLYQVEGRRPPVQSRAPDRERPANNAGDLGPGPGVGTEEQQRECI